MNGGAFDPMSLALALGVLLAASWGGAATGVLLSIVVDVFQRRAERRRGAL